MKKIRHLVLACLMALAILFAVQTPAQAATEGMSYSYTTDTNSITINWPTPTTSYTITGYSIYDYNSGSYIATNLSASTHSYTLTGISRGYVGYWRVSYNYITSFGYTGNNYTLGSIHVNNAPSTLSTKNFGIYSLYNDTSKTNQSKVSFAAVRSSSDFKCQIQVYKGSKLAKTMNFYSYSDSMSVYDNAAYRYRVRQYYYNSDTGKNSYGSWSTWHYFDSCSATLKYTTSTRGCTFTLKKVGWIKNYKVYVSTKKDSGFVGTAIVTVTGSTKKVTLTKIGKNAMKKGTTYYVRVVPYFYVGGKYFASETYAQSSFYNAK